MKGTASRALTYQAHAMRPDLESYQQNREVLLTGIITELSNDERCTAAWLTGSYATNEADALSDLDITVAIAEPHSKVWCARQEQVSYRTTKERLALFSTFGKPAILHENNHNAPAGGTFTFVMYAESKVMVDWVLVPLRTARRPSFSRLLFDKANIPVSPAPEPEEVAQSQKYVAEQWAFFWMMTAITIKYMIRQDDVFVTRWLEELHHINHELERRIQRFPLQYKRGSFSQFQATREKRTESLQKLVRSMQELQSRAIEFTGTELSIPLAEIEFLLLLANESDAGN